VLPNPVVPNGQPLYNHYSMLGSVSADPNAAIAAFEAAIKDNPGNADGYFNLARAQEHLKQDHADAEANAHKALQIDPNYGDAYALLGQILTEEQRFDEAADNYGKAVAIGYMPAESMLSEGAALGQAGHYDQAMECLQKGLAQKPDDESGLEMLGNCYYMLKNADLAKQYWKKALAVQPNNDKLRQTYQSVFKEAP
jgi:tetratricopeptide (TPR) repeat protein